MTTVKYETNVPTPVVELSIPSSIPAKELAVGESLIFNATLTNKGLITAQDVQLLMPEGFKALAFEPLSNTDPFDLAPQQSVQIPVKVTHVSLGANVPGLRRAGHIDNDPCVGQPGTLYYWDCGNDRKWHRYKVALQLGSCNSKDSTTWSNPGNGNYGIPGGGGYYPVPHTGIGGGGYYGSSSTNNQITGSTTDDCEPCQNKFLLQLVDCGLELIPAYRTLKAVVGCAKGIFDTVNEFRNPNASIAHKINVAASTVETCLGAVGIGSGDKDTERENEREEALMNIIELLKNISSTYDKVESFEGNSWSENVDLLQSLGEKISSLAGFDFDKYKRLFCFAKLLEPCDLEGEPEKPSRSSRKMSKANNNQPSYMQEHRDMAAFGIYEELAWISVLKLVFGQDNEWLSCDENDRMDFLGSALCTMNEDGYIDSDKIQTLLDNKPESISKSMVNRFVERINNTVMQLDSENKIDFESIADCIDVVQKIEKTVNNLGYESVSECYEESYKKTLKTAQERSGSVCSSITLQFEQKMVLTRQAFRGTLTVFNGSEDAAMTDVKLNLVVTDESGKVATSHEFQINPESFTGFTGSLNFEDGWTLDAQETGVAKVLFIPTKFAAPTVEKQYSFGGTLSYIDPFTGLEVTRTLTPITLTVKPSPNLDLTYFMQRDIIGDDPLTEDIEPCEEAEFSLLINNIGYGDATNVKMITNQPEIVDNEKGLLIDFELMSSQLNGGDKTLALGSSVATDFGTIPAKSTSYAQWWLKSSLLGHFTDYDVQATHVTSYGNPDLTLLNDVTIHELIRSLEITDGGNKMVGFMTNDIADADDTPDMLYLSNGEIETVAVTASSSIVKTSDADYTLTVNPSAAGWNYGNLTDPTYGVVKLKKVVRQSDGKEISLRNFWQTDRTLRDGKDPLYENRIHFADNFTTGAAETYVLTFEPMPELMLEVASIEGTPAEGTIAYNHVEKVNVMFNKHIDPATFSADDITLNVQGKKQDASLIDITTEDNKTFVLDFIELNKQTDNGYYVLTIQTAEITDAEGFNGKTGKSIGWNMYKDGLILLNTSVNPADAGTISGNRNSQYGETASLMAEANEGYEFSHWSVNGDKNGNELVWSAVVSCDMDITANFIKKTYVVNIDENVEGGSITGYSTGIYPYGEEIKLTVTPNADYEFCYWIVNGEKDDTNASLAIVVSKATSISAKFKYIGQYHLRQNIAEGWNWVSSFIAAPQAVDGLFKNGANRVMSQTQEAVDDPVYGIVGNVKNIEPGAGYKVNSAKNFALTWSGLLVDTDERPIVLRKGWNWIGYPYYESRAIETAIVNAEEGDFVVAQGGFTEFADGAWGGSIERFDAGQGYLYKSVSDKTLQFDFAEQAARVKAAEGDEPTPNTNDSEPNADGSAYSVHGSLSKTKSTGLDIHKYPNTMNVTARLWRDGAEVTDGRYVVKAFSDSELRGEGVCVNGTHYVTVYGDKAVEIAFVIEDTETGEQFSVTETLAFTSDVVGSRKSPFALTMGAATGIADAKAGKGAADIYTVSGVKVQRASRPGVYVVNGRKVVVR